MSTDTCSKEPSLKIKKIQDVLVLHLNDLNSKNALSLELAEQINQAISKQDFKALLLTHEGDFFCSGGHLKNYQQMNSKSEGLEVNQRISAILENLNSLKIPKACAVNGMCLGGGIELLACFDYVSASPSSLFGLWQRRVGLNFGWGGEERLLKKIASSQLKRWLLDGETLSAYTALDMGLINSISFSCHTQDDCLRWLNKVINLGFATLSEILDQSQDSEKTFSKLWLGETHMKALQKFK
jgi:enoyl-CoA hydratase/carnithine racemase